MQTIEIIGLIAAMLTTGAFVPQVYKVFKSKSTTDISLTMYTVLFIGLMLWLLYGIQKESFPIILANAITGLLVAAVIILKLKYK
ncbi:SemiSWEET family sugar transporter [uncultured Croceitalea sp.]|uniref:SemiSWEET family sugar transporter n=1 Tax=uncultured Croceitalea sp. TaxID=1798908 RepID=UPI00374FD94A